MVKAFWFAVAILTGWGVWLVWPRSGPPSPLVVACTKGWGQEVDRLLAAGADPNRATTRFEELERSPQDMSPIGIDTPLSAAVGEASIIGRAGDYMAKNHLVELKPTNRYKIVKTLLNHGADPSRQVNGTAPIFSAAEYSAPSVLQLLIQHGASVSARDREGLTPLLAVARNFPYPQGDFDDSDTYCRDLSWGTSRCVHLLVRAGADLEARDPYGRTPLHMAALRGDTAMAEALIADGAHLKPKDMGGLTPKDCARTIEMYEFLDRAGG